MDDKSERSSARLDVLRLARKRANMSIKEIARAMNVDPAYVSNVELGHKSPGLAFLSKYAKAVGDEPNAYEYLANSALNRQRFNRLIQSFANASASNRHAIHSARNSSPHAAIEMPKEPIASREAITNAIIDNLKRPESASRISF